METLDLRLDEGALMGTFTSPAGVDWAGLDFYLSELTNALWERQLLAPVESSAVAQGDLLASVSAPPTYAIFSLQHFAEALYDGYLNHKIAIEGSNRVPMIGWNQATFAEEIGLNPVEGSPFALGWRRTQVHPDDPAFAGFEEGYIQDGDIVGAWLFEDLQRACCAMQAIKPFGCVLPSDGISSVDGWIYHQMGHGADIPEATANAEAAEEQYYPNAFAGRVSYIEERHGFYRAYRARWRGTVVLASFDLDCEIDLYALRVDEPPPAGPVEDEGDWVWALLAGGLTPDDSPVDVGNAAYMAWPSGVGVASESATGLVAVVRPSFTHDQLPE